MLDLQQVGFTFSHFCRVLDIDDVTDSETARGWPQCRYSRQKGRIGRVGVYAVRICDLDFLALDVDFEVFILDLYRPDLFKYDSDIGG